MLIDSRNKNVMNIWNMWEIKLEDMDYPNMNLNQRKNWWKRLSRYWQMKNTGRQNAEYNSFSNWQKEASKVWLEEAYKYNEEIWRNMPSHSKSLMPWSEARNHHAGFAIIYRKYIELMDIDDAMDGIIIDPIMDPNQYIA